MQIYKTQRIHLYIGIAMLLIALGSFGIASAQTVAGALTQDEKERATGLAANTANRSGAAIDRLTNINERLDARIRLLEADGYNMAITWEHTGNAKGALESAGSRLIDIESRVLAMVASENPQQAWAPIKADFLAAKEDLLDAQRFLREAVASIKVSMQNGREGQEEAMEMEAEAEVEVDSTLQVQ